MTDSTTMQGSCLCGAVTLKVPAKRGFEACHCGMCRRWGGGPLLAIACGTAVDIVGEDSIQTYSSSDWAERGFCRTCGTHLYYLFKPAGQYIVPQGLFQDQQDFEFTEQIFIDRKPSYYAFANDTPVLTEQEVIGKYMEG